MWRQQLDLKAEIIKNKAMIRIYQPSMVAIVMFSMILLEFSVDASKLRIWEGPDTFFEGALPSPRQALGLTSTDDGQLFLFGGWGSNGWQENKYFNCFIEACFVLMYKFTCPTSSHDRC